MDDERYYANRVFEGMRCYGEIFEDYKFEECTFVNCVFEECALMRTSFLNCVFDRCKITSLKTGKYSKLQFCQFTDCKLVGIQWNELMSAGRFAAPISQFQNCYMKYNTFTEMNFKKFVFTGNEIADSMFADCQLNESKFKNCHLERTEFFRCDMQKADFRDATGYQVDIMTCQLKGASFSFPEVVNLLGSLQIKI